MNRSVNFVAKGHGDERKRSDYRRYDERRWRLSRVYDPACCATHALGKMPLEVNFTTAKML